MQRLSLLREHDYHAVLSDIRMAGMDGVALLNQIRERWPDSPVILMTAAGHDREGEALCSGAFSFVEKPIDLERLGALLTAAMAKSQLQQRVREANRHSVSAIDVEAQRMGLAIDLRQRPPSD
jgi:DNA-binding NtrC family response regulator